MTGLHWKMINLNQYSLKSSFLISSNCLIIEIHVQQTTAIATISDIMQNTHKKVKVTSLSLRCAIKVELSISLVPSR